MYQAPLKAQSSWANWNMLAKGDFIEWSLKWWGRRRRYCSKGMGSDWLLKLREHAVKDRTAITQDIQSLDKCLSSSHSVPLWNGTDETRVPPLSHLGSVRGHRTETQGKSISKRLGEHRLAETRECRQSDQQAFVTCDGVCSLERGAKEAGNPGAET